MLSSVISHFCPACKAVKHYGVKRIFTFLKILLFLSVSPLNSRSDYAKLESQYIIQFLSLLETDGYDNDKKHAFILRPSYNPKYDLTRK